ncbi:MAG: DUF1834 family protein [Deltaproteobacteria bacterium]|nr:DUF1834 family protein [Deltaproteobacteria bacterium]
MITRIEDAVVERVKSKLQTASSKVAVQKGTVGIPQPAIYVSTEEAHYEKTTQTAFRARLTLYLDVIFSHLGGEKERRKGIYLMLEGLIQALLLQDLGLKIAPIIPKGFRNVTTDELLKKGLIAYSLEMETSYYVAKIDDELLVDLLKAGLSYYLKPGDETADATETVNLPV